MEAQCSPLTWAYYYQEEGFDELKQSLLYSTLELEAAVISAHDEISRKDDEILHLKTLLSKVVEERDEFRAKSQLLLHQVQILAPSPSNEKEDHIIEKSSSDSKDTLPLTPIPEELTDVIALKRPLPEKGKFLQAVMEAGPLLQTLLVAGPLPRWQHPPPQLNSIDIPPVTMGSPAATMVMNQDSCIISPTTSGGLTNKRAMVSSDFSPSTKYQKACSPTMVDPQHI